MTLCDKCFAPGQCCKNLTLSRNGKAWTVWQGDADAAMERRGLPFRSLEVIGQWSDAEGTWEEHSWYCPKLGEDGRCTIYEDRPDICRNYKPGSDPLCVHYNGAEGGELGLAPWLDA